MNYNFPFPGHPFANGMLFALFLTWVGGLLGLFLACIT